MYNHDKICQRFVVVWTLVLPTLVEKLVEFIPSLKFEHSFKLQLDNLEVFGNNVGLRRSTEFLYTFCCSLSKFLTVFAGFQVVMNLN
jgi:hypothetical protein